MDGKLVLDSGPEIAYPNDQQQAKTKGLSLLSHALITQFVS